MDTENKVLEPVENKLSIETSSEIKPQDFFQSREGLYVWSDFNERILEKALSVAAGTKYELASFKLLESSSDETIESALPKVHIFSESDACAIIAELISKQSKGEEGTLLNNGYFNIFYTPTFVVGVVWGSDGGSWRVDAWVRDNVVWYAGTRVFSPATDL